MEIKGIVSRRIVPGCYQERNESDAKLINFFSACKTLVMNFVNIGILRLTSKMFGIK